MTLQQMRYAVMVAEKQSFGKAAIELFISQPSLSNAIHGLETELGIELFTRTTKGVQVSPQGYPFIEAAKRIIAQSDAVLSQYTEKAEEMLTYFSVSSLHYGFSIHAFSNLLAVMDSNHYDMRFRDAGCLQIIQDVADRRSEIGILDVGPENNTTVLNLLKKHHLEFQGLYATSPYILLRKGHPLAEHGTIQLEELELYPLISYENDMQGCSDDWILTKQMPKSRLRVQDRSTMISLLRTTNSYAVGSGIFRGNLFDGLKAIPVEETEEIKVGWIKMQGQALSPLAEQYVNLLRSEMDHERENTNSQI